MPTTPTSQRVSAWVDRERRPGLDAVTVPRPGLEEIHLTVRPLEGEEPPGLFRRLARAVREREADVLKLTAFGRTDAYPAGLEALSGAFGEVDWPVTWVQGGSCSGGPLAGLQVSAIRGVSVRTLALRGRTVGRVFRDPSGVHCCLGGLTAPDPSVPRASQAAAVFESLEEALRLAGLEMADVVRTWLFLDRMLSWYPDLNAVRTRFYQERGLFDRLVPASTGIGAGNPAGTALVAEALAFRPVDGTPRVEEVTSPLQCSAGRYGSSFSRAVEVRLPGLRQLLVSGTASIDPEGQSAHRGDLEAQVALTLRVMEALLTSRGMDWGDVTRAVAYVKRATDAPAFERHWRTRGLPPLPLVITESDVCRPELLFEMELDAVVATPV